MSAPRRSPLTPIAAPTPSRSSSAHQSPPPTAKVPVSLQLHSAVQTIQMDESSVSSLLSLASTSRSGSEVGSNTVVRILEEGGAFGGARPPLRDVQPHHISAATVEEVSGLPFVRLETADLVPMDVLNERFEAMEKMVAAEVEDVKQGLRELRRQTAEAERRKAVAELCQAAQDGIEAFEEILFRLAAEEGAIDPNNLDYLIQKASSSPSSPPSRTSLFDKITSSQASFHNFLLTPVASALKAHRDTLANEYERLQPLRHVHAHSAGDSATRSVLLKRTRPDLGDQVDEVEFAMWEGRVLEGMQLRQLARVEKFQLNAQRSLFLVALVFPHQPSLRTISALLEVSPMSPPFALRVFVSEKALASPSVKAFTKREADAVKEGRLKLVSGSLADSEALRTFLTGVDGVLAAWSASPVSFEEGKTVIDMVKTLDSKHFILSSLPSLAAASTGQCTEVKNFETKAAIERYARNTIPDKLSVIICGFPYGMLNTPLFTRRDDTGLVIFSAPVSPSSSWEWLHSSHDIGIAAAAILSAGPARTTVSSGCSSYPLMGPGLTPAELAAEYEAVTGEKAVARPDDLEESLKALPEALAVQMRAVLRYMDSVAGKPFYGILDASEEKNLFALDIAASSFSEFIERTGWRVREKG